MYVGWPIRSPFVRKTLEQDLHIPRSGNKLAACTPERSAVDQPRCILRVRRIHFTRVLHSEDLVIPWEGRRLTAVAAAASKIKAGQPVTVVMLGAAGTHRVSRGN